MCCHEQGYVESKIDTSGDQSPFLGDNRSPKLSAMALDSKCMTTTENFDMWYNDRDTAIVRPFRYDITLNEVEPGIWGINSSAYFPLDNQAYWIPFYPGGPSTFGYQSGGNHNFGFTTEIHSQITYYKGTGQFFTFSGDDDVWAFINDSLVIDLGGVHQKLTRSLYLDSLPDGFLQDGKTYAFDFFHAERHTSQSNLAILTNFRLETYDLPGLTAQVYFSNSSTFGDATEPQSYTRSSDTLFVQIHDDSKTSHIDTTTIVISGPGGEKETVKLIELRESPGTYRGYIVFGTSTEVTPGDGTLDIPYGASITYTADDADVPGAVVPTPPTATTNRAPVPVSARYRIANNGKGFTLTVRDDGRLSVYSPNGRLELSVYLEAGQVYPMKSVPAGNHLYRWETAREISTGHMALVK